MSPSPGPPWTEADDDQLRTLAAAGESCSTIAELFKRSDSNPQAGSHAQDQVGPFAARAEDEKHPETEGEGEVAALARTPWTPEEDKRLRMLIEACEPIEFIAAELKRSANAVKGRAYELRISLKRVNLNPKAKGK